MTWGSSGSSISRTSSSSGAVDRAHHDRSGVGRASTCISPMRYENDSEWRPVRPPVCITPSSGVERRLGERVGDGARATRRAARRGRRRRQRRRARPRPRRDSNSSPVNRQRWSTAACTRRWLSSVPSPSRTTQLRRVTQVVGGLLDRLAGERGERRRRSTLSSPASTGSAYGVVQELAHDDVGEVVVGLLDEQRVEELVLVAPVGVVVLVANAAVRPGPRSRRRTCRAPRA